MKRLAAYVADFIRVIDKRSLVYIAILTAVAVFLNYHFRIEHTLLATGNKLSRFVSFLVIYVVVFAGSYMLLPGWKQKLRQKRSKFFIGLLIAVPAIFAVRVASGLITNPVSGMVEGDWGRYLSIIFNAPLKFILLLLVIRFIKRSGNYEERLTGLQKGTICYTPFLIGIAIFLPVIAIAASQPDFLRAYPKFRRIAFIFDDTSQPWITAIIYELSYAFDFLFTEVFFRGLLVFAFVRFAGAAAILPMAALYCAIHFGKPLAECISSFFGGMLLGIISFRTGSVMGGLVLHLGIGWLMELAGFYYGG